MTYLKTKKLFEIQSVSEKNLYNYAKAQRLRGKAKKYEYIS